jgi:hypothetical protein
MIRNEEVHGLQNRYNEILDRWKDVANQQLSRYVEEKKSYNEDLISDHIKNISEPVLMYEDLNDDERIYCEDYLGYEKFTWRDNIYLVYRDGSTDPEISLCRYLLALQLQDSLEGDVIFSRENMLEHKSDKTRKFKLIKTESQLYSEIKQDINYDDKTYVVVLDDSVFSIGKQFRPFVLYDHLMDSLERGVI